jgi:hypothetical protein
MLLLQLLDASVSISHSEKRGRRRPSCTATRWLRKRMRRHTLPVPVGDSSSAFCDDCSASTTLSMYTFWHSYGSNGNVMLTPRVSKWLRFAAGDDDGGGAASLRALEACTSATRVPSTCTVTSTQRQHRQRTTSKKTRRRVCAPAWRASFSRPNRHPWKRPPVQAPRPRSAL